MKRFSNNDIARQIGTRSLQRLNAFLEEYNSEGDPTFVYSPSIICRSEIEMLGFSLPRFAYRLEIKNGSRQSGFVNVRRLEELHRQFKKSPLQGFDSLAGIPAVYTESDLHTSHDKLEPLLFFSGPFAESVLPKPKRLGKHNVIEQDFREYFGIDYPVIGTPFVNALLLGGSMCGHGATFIALMLMLPHIRQVFCPSEMAALLANSLQELPSEITATSFSVKGFDETHFTMILKDQRIGLQSFQEYAKIDLDFLKPDLAGESIEFPRPRNLVPFKAARGYVRSGYPVILLVDSKRFTNVLNQINHRNNRNAKLYRELSEGDTDQPSTIRHSIVLVGTGESEQTQFVVNDPSTLPFRDFMLSDLAGCLPQVISEEGNQTDGNVVQWRMFPVIPDGVEMSLLDTKDEGGKLYPGLIKLSECILSRKRMPGLADLSDSSGQLEKLPSWRPGKATWREPNSRGEFRLVSKSDLDNEEKLKALKSRHTNDSGYLLSFLDQIHRYDVNKFPDWIWIQFIEHSTFELDSLATVWVWDAGQKLHSCSVDIVDMLVLVESCQNADGSDLKNLWLNPRIDFAQDFGSPEREVEDPVEGKSDLDCSELSFSFISSCNLTPFSETSGLYTQYNSNCELYCFMQSDIDLLRAPFGACLPDGFRAPIEDVNLSEFLSWIGEDDKHVEKVAEIVCSHFEHTRIVGLASYLPEIGLPPVSGQRSFAIGALRMLIKLACCLKSKKFNQSALTSIEFVGGSRCVGLDWKRLSNRVAEVGLSSIRQEIEWLTESLRDATDGMRSSMRENKIALAAEMEPGLLRSLASPWTLEEFIGFDSAMDGILGCNIDVGHLAIGESQQQENNRPAYRECVQRLIAKAVHCHLSLHKPYKGHFCDSPIYSPKLPDLETYYLKLFVEECRRRKQGETQASLPISNCISLELEASTDTSILRKSVENAKIALGF